jgi:hypothetical protein
MAETLTLDGTTATFVRLLREHLTTEPLLPNENMPRGLQESVADTRRSWERQVSAYRLLIGVRLTNLALEGGAECTCGALSSVQHFAPCPLEVTE